MITVSDRLSEESAKDYVLRQLTYNIINVNLTPGEQIDIPELCTLFGVSRSPVREAELDLASRQLIDIRPKIGAFVSYIDAELVEEVRQLRSILEAELAVMACDVLTPTQIDKLWENIAMWQMYISRGNDEKTLLLDKEFHAMIYKMCGKSFWLELIESASPHFDRTSILSVKCHKTDNIIHDHQELVTAIEQHDKEKAARIAKLHMTRYIENFNTLKENFPDYFKK